MERISILIDKRHLDLKEVGYNIETPKFLCEHCGVILSSKQSEKHHMVVKHSEKVTTYQYSKCPTTCNRLDNIRRHIRKHPGQTNTPKTVMYEIKQMSPKPEPKRWRQIPKARKPLLTRPYFSEPTNTNDCIYQQILKPQQTPIPWRLIPIDLPPRNPPEDLKTFHLSHVTQTNPPKI